VFYNHVTTVTNVKTVKLCSKVAKIRIYKRFFVVFDINRVFEIYDRYFDNCHVTV